MVGLDKIKRLMARMAGAFRFKLPPKANRTTLRLLVIMAPTRRALTRSGIMQFLTIEEETGLIEAVAQPDI